MTIAELKNKHSRLKKLDGGSFWKRPQYKVFGSDSHGYKFNAPLSIEQIKRFEEQHRILLPDDYRNFLLTVGNGGSGPAYGLLPLWQWNIELEIEQDDFLSIPFPHADQWNMVRDFDMEDDAVYESEAFQKWEEDYYSNDHITGSIRICHYGCAIYYLLVVTGDERGMIWVDDRANDLGIYPAVTKGKRLDFVSWYDGWLDEGMELYR